MSFKEKVEQICQEALLQIKSSSTLDVLENLRIQYLGRKSEIVQLLRSLGTFPPDERREFGALSNRVKTQLEEAFSSREEALGHLSSRGHGIDKTLPSAQLYPGREHPLVRVMSEIEEILMRLGFSIAEGPEVETEANNFSFLNIPADHPSRDMQDTFYINADDEKGGKLLLRTHTSPVQIRVMKSMKPPVRIISTGRVFRHEAIDSTHAACFHQVECLSVDEGVSMSDLKWTLERFAQEMFGSKVRIRFRPSYFPFVEPGAEVDVSCMICRGKGCRVCKNSGWLEMLGAGMVHPHVFRSVGYDTERVSGFAFGLGVERVAMLKLGVDDMRLFFENDMRFLSQI